MCVQIPDNLQALNTQVEIYNKKYVIISEKSWKAYLDGGETMKIDLKYNEEYETYLFYYTFWIKSQNANTCFALAGGQWKEKRLSNK